MRVNKIQMAKLKLTKLDHLVTSGWVYKTGYMYNRVGVLTSQHIPSYPPLPSLDLNILLVKHTRRILRQFRSFKSTKILLAHIWYVVIMFYQEQSSLH